MLSSLVFSDGSELCRDPDASPTCGRPWRLTLADGTVHYYAHPERACYGALYVDGCHVSVSNGDVSAWLAGAEEIHREHTRQREANEASVPPPRGPSFADLDRAKWRELHELRRVQIEREWERPSEPTIEPAPPASLVYGNAFWKQLTGGSWPDEDTFVRTLDNGIHQQQCRLLKRRTIDRMWGTGLQWHVGLVFSYPDKGPSLIVVFVETYKPTEIRRMGDPMIWRAGEDCPAEPPEFNGWDADAWKELRALWSGGT